MEQVVGQAVSRREMEQLDKRFTAGLEHLSTGMSSIQEAIVLLTTSMVDLKVTQERVVTSMEEQKKILAKVTDTEERCTHLERELDSLKLKVTTMEEERKALMLEKKDKKKWSRRLVVTFIFGLFSTIAGYAIKHLMEG